MKTIYQTLLTAAFILTFSLSAAFGQTTPAKPATTETVSNYSLTVEDIDGKQTKISLSDIGKLPRKTVKANDHGKETTFEGFALIEVLQLAKIEFGEKLRGKRMSNFLLVEAADKYQAVFALPELEPTFTDKIILLADRRNGQPLSKEEGVLRVVVPDEKRQARWVRQVVGLKILDAANVRK